MCPCPFCAGLVILLSPLLLFPATRNWLKSKVNRHHCGCETCQKAEHEQNMSHHTPCHCQACLKKTNQKRKNKT